MGGESDKKETQVEVQMGRMCKELEELTALMACLEGKLKPCLRSVPAPAPASEAAKTAQPSLVPLASALWIFNDRMRTSIKMATAIAERIEL